MDEGKDTLEPRKVGDALTTRPRPGRSCPACGSHRVASDSPGTYRFFFSLLVFPITLLLLLANRNRYCRACGVRFKELP